MRRTIRRMLEKVFGKSLKKIEAIVNWIMKHIAKAFPKRRYGRKRMKLSYVVWAILYRTRTECPWYQLPDEFGNHKTIHGWFLRLSRLSVINKAFYSLLEALSKAGQISVRNVIFDGSLAQAPRGGKLTKKNPRMRNRCCINRVISVNGSGAPLAAMLVKGTAHDSPFLPILLEKVHETCTLKKNFTGHGDRGFDASTNFCAISKLRGKAQIAVRYRKGDFKMRSNKDSMRWKVERTNSWVNQFRAVKYCYERLSETLESIYFTAFAVILSRFVSLKQLISATARINA
jgi:transposase